MGLLIMKLRFLHECTSTAAIAMRPMALAVPKRTKRKVKKQEQAFPISDGYMGVSSAKHPKNDKTLVWQPNESGKDHKKHWWEKYSQTVDQDERLLPQFRGKGY